MENNDNNENNFIIYKFNNENKSFLEINIFLLYKFLNYLIYFIAYNFVNKIAFKFINLFIF